MKMNLQRGRIERAGWGRWLMRHTDSKQLRLPGVLAFFGLSLLALTSLTAFPAAAQPINDNFIDAEVLLGASSNTAGDSTGATPEPGEPPHYGFGGSSVWFTWTAPSSGVVTFDTLGAP